MTTDASVLRCTRCRQGRLAEDSNEAWCTECGARFPVRYGIIDLLGDPLGPVRTELQGLAAENGIDLSDADFDSVKFLRTAEIESTAELMDRSRRDPIRYYQQTSSAYFEALSRADLDSHLTVIEVGSERSLWKLRVIEDLCDEAIALNIFFHVADAPDSTGPRRVLADMNDLPVEDGSVDLVIFSATLHHSSDLAGALREAARVVRVGGRVIVVNEPVAGRLKRLGGRLGHDRHEAIHEDDVTYSEWMSAISASGLRADHFVPAWFLGQLAARRPLNEGTRFRQLGRALSPLLRQSGVRDVARACARRPAQRLLGLPLNAVLWRVR